MTLPTETTLLGDAAPSDASCSETLPAATFANGTIWSGHATAEEIERWSTVATTVAESLARDAVERDRANTQPDRELELFRDSGLANLMVPASLGGSGAHWETAFRVTRIIARADASIAQLLGYHYLNQACVVFYGTDPDEQREWLRRSAAGSWLWSDSFNPVSPDLTLRADGDSYRLNGVKRFATGAAVADVVVAGAIAEGGSLDGQFLIFAIPRGRDGVVHPDDWDNMGYRASASGSVRYTDVRITRDDVIGIDTEEPFSSVVTPGVQLLFGNVYLGIAEGALAKARELTCARSGSWFLSTADSHAKDPVIQRLIGELVAKTAAVEALADSLNRRFDAAAAKGIATTADDRAELEIAIARLKVISTEVGLEVTSRIFEASGASSTRASVGLDRYWRDLRTHSLHDPVEYKKIEVGANFLDGTVQPVSLYT